jgi:hypothetical protein
MEISRILLDAGHNIDTADKYGITPLMYAAGMGNSQVVKMLILRGANTTKVESRWKRSFISYASIYGHWQLIFKSLDTIRSFYPEKGFHYFVDCAIMTLISKDQWIDDLVRAAHFEKLIGLCGDVNFTFDNSHTGTSQNNLLHHVKSRKEADALLCHGFKNFNQANSHSKLAMHSIAQWPKAEWIQICLENGSNPNHVDKDGRTILSHLISQLGHISWLVWDTIDSIKLCMAHGADILLPDNCDCPCSSDGNGCHTSSAFNLQPISSIFERGPGFTWAFEWLSIVEEFQGHEASRRMLLSFVRRTQADIVDITHVCCHGGTGVITQDWAIFRAERPPKKDAMEILDEEEEFIEILDQDMQSWMNLSFKEIMSQWMTLLKRKHKEAMKSKKNNCGKNPGSEVSHTSGKNSPSNK